MRNKSFIDYEIFIFEIIEIEHLRQEVKNFCSFSRVKLLFIDNSF